MASGSSVLRRQPEERLDVFGALGFKQARSARTASLWDCRSTDELPKRPEYTARWATQLRARFADPSRCTGVANRVYGADFYDDANTEGKDGTTLANFRAARAPQSVRGTWVMNAFDSGIPRRVRVLLSRSQAS